MAKGSKPPRTAANEKAWKSPHKAPQPGLATAPPKQLQRSKGGRKAREVVYINDVNLDTEHAAHAPAIAYRAAAAFAWGTAGGTPLADAHGLISNRLLQPCSRAAAAMHVRPQLQTVANCIEDSLQSRISGRGGNNPSILLFGEHGSGRLLVAEKAVASAQRRNNISVGCPVVCCVRLRGTLHTEERTAFREIARQLCLELGLSFVRSASHDDNLRFLSKIMADLKRSHKVIVFVLEDFDQFAKPAGKRQSILYNILDFINTPGVQAALIGTTAVYSAIDAMEKRVLSRFSHRAVNLKLPRLWSGCRDGGTALSVLSDMLMLPPSGSGATSHHDTFSATWNAALKAALEHPATQAAITQEAQGSTTSMSANPGVSPGALAGVAMRFIDGVNGTADTHRQLIRAIKSMDALAGIQVKAVAELTVLEAFMVGAAYRVTSRKPNPVQGFNFLEIWDEVEHLQQMQPHPDHYPRDRAWRAYESLFKLRLFSWCNSRLEKQGCLREFLPAQLQLPYGVIQQGFAGHQHVPTMLYDWVGKLAVANNSFILA